MSESDSDSSLGHFAYKTVRGRRFSPRNFKPMLAYNPHKMSFVPPEGDVELDPDATEVVTQDRTMLMPVACIRFGKRQGTAFAVTPILGEGAEREQLWLSVDHVTRDASGTGRLSRSEDVAYFNLRKSVPAEVVTTRVDTKCDVHYLPPDDPGFHDPFLVNGPEYEDLDVSVLSVCIPLDAPSDDAFLVPYSGASLDLEFCKFALQGYPGALDPNTVVHALHLNKNTPVSRRYDYILRAQSLFFPNRMNVSIGTVISSNKYFVKHNASSFKGMSGGPGMPLAAPHTFAFIQVEGDDIYNVGISKDHPMLVQLYKDHILPKLTSAVAAGLVPEPQLSALLSWVQQHADALPGAAAFQAACA